MNTKLTALLVLFGLTIASANIVLAADDSTAPLNETMVSDMLKQQGLEEAVVGEIISALKKDKDGNAQALSVGTVLFTHGGNGAFFVDNDNWNFDGAINYKGRLATVSNLFDGYVFDGGMNIELVYKWIWVFIPEGTSINSLDGAAFGGKLWGRGVALTGNIVPNSPLGLEFGWIPRQNGIGNAFIVAVKAGIMSGAFMNMKYVKNAEGQKRLQLTLPAITFPRIEFKQKALIK